MDLDEFSDDGLDDLPDNALQALENNAIQLTQAPNKSTQQPGLTQSEAVWIEDDDLDTTEVINNDGEPIGRPVVDHTLQLSQHTHQNQYQESRRPLPPPNPRWNPAIDPSKRGRAVQPPSQGPYQMTVNQPLYTSQQFQTSSNFQRTQASQFVRPPIPQNQFTPSQGHSRPGDALSALQQRVRALESELNIARGEASIIRNNATKAQQQHDAEVVRLKKLNAEQLNKQERITEAALASEQSAHTELQFLQRDLREVNDRARRKDGSVSATANVTTPKKTAKTWRVADGFDEMDIVLSPSKGQGRNKNAASVATHVGERTPSKGKRKRPAVDSPIMALETHIGDMDLDKSTEPVTTAPPPTVMVPASALPFEFLKLVLDHTLFLGHSPTFEVLSRFAFPSEPTTSLAAYIFKRLPIIGGDSRHPVQLLVDFSRIVVDLWSRSLEEQYWEPINYLVALVAFTFQLQATEVAPLLVANLSPVAQATICNLAGLKHRLSEADQKENEQFKALAENINIPDILSLLHITSLACSTSVLETESGIETKAAYFWSHISLDTPSILLTAKQDLSDIISTLDLLATSSLPGSIGPITDEKDPPFVAQLIIDKVVIKLTENPIATITPKNKRKLQLAVVRTLLAFARYPFGAIQLAIHNSTLPRLVNYLSTCIDELYNQSIPSSILPEPPKRGGFPIPISDAPTELCHIISQCVLLIHTLVTGPHTSNLANINQKLSTSHGGSQRYLLALGRLTFAEEDLVMESGITEETIEAAHELLELVVTPDEGEIVSEAFGA
ncbi:hypothetical protein BGZ63DRAFT_495193 [Mariannaea sp. PMI_226]|nr:hypothetical protein BGZ63DRAFT_495193 [Mariannaea sp. PMI_226]